MKTYLITGGAGFVGCSLAIRLKRDQANTRVIAMDNLRRRGSELSVSHLKMNGVEFVHADIRVKEDLDVSGKVDCIIECSAEASVLAGYNSSPEYVVSTNLVGTLNCLELARRHGSDFVFLSSSRVYPIKSINSLQTIETESRYELIDEQRIPGTSSFGLTEEFPLEGTRSLYGATKLASELIIREYLEMYRLRGIINRCGVLTGAGQMGKVDQGFVSLWVARHIFGIPLNYVGYGGNGKQVRDILHVEDLYKLLRLQMNHLDDLSGQVFNVGGGRAISVSLRELTSLCEEVTNKQVEIEPVAETRVGDVRVYVSDHSKVSKYTGWVPSIPALDIVSDIAAWIQENRIQLESILR